MDFWTNSCSWHLGDWNSNCGAASSRESLIFTANVQSYKGRDRRVVGYGTRRAGCSQKFDQVAGNDALPLPLLNALDNGKMLLRHDLNYGNQQGVRQACAAIVVIQLLSRPMMPSLLNPRPSAINFSSLELLDV